MRGIAEAGWAPAVRLWPFLTAVWCVLFAVPHVYWAFGGRKGLGSQADDADVALGTWWFAAYNDAVIVACMAGVVLCVAAFRTGGLPLRRLCLLVAVALWLRGLVGVAGLVVGTARTPLVLLLVEPAFVVGGLLWWRMAVPGIRPQVQRDQGGVTCQAKVDPGTPRSSSRR